LDQLHRQCKTNEVKNRWLRTRSHFGTGYRKSPPQRGRKKLKSTMPMPVNGTMWFASRFTSACRSSPRDTKSSLTNHVYTFLYHMLDMLLYLKFVGVHKTI
jgi:hypothetical protein